MKCESAVHLDLSDLQTCICLWRRNISSCISLSSLHESMKQLPAYCLSRLERISFFPSDVLSSSQLMEIHLIPVWHFKSLHEIHLTVGEKSSSCMIVCYLANINLHLWVSEKQQSEKEMATKQFVTVTKRERSKAETLVWFMTRCLSHR